MKNDITFLPERKQRDLRELVRLIREEVKDVVMIILYGSYATNSYVDCDERHDFGMKTYYMSDYDLMVVTKKRLGTRESTVASRVKNRFLERNKEEFQTRPQIINESISKLNDALSVGRYFYVEIISQGIMLYDTGEYSLAVPQKLDYSHVSKIAAEYFNDKFTTAKQFIVGTRLYYDVGYYKLASLQLHQAVEYLLRTIPLIFILYGYKEHDIEFLIEKCKVYTIEIAKAFPRNSVDEERLFKLIQRAYIEARYNPDFEITKEDIDALLPKVEMLCDITEKVCKQQLAFYAAQIKK